MDLLIAGGGTGGHLFPGIALAQELRRRDPKARILFVGSPRGIETQAVPRAGFDLALLPVSGLRRTGVKGLVLGLARLPIALAKALRLVRSFRPHVALSVGGYAAGPAVLAARLWGIPCAVLEQNSQPGFTNRVLGKLSRQVFTALPTRGFAAHKLRVLGNPVRAELLSVRERGYAPAQPLRLFVFGGSQGARALNDVMIAAAPKLAAISIDHQTGAADVERVQRGYERAGLTNAKVRPFIYDMASAYRDADLVLCRAGATTIAELCVCGRPSILVPFPRAVGDHQSANARGLAQAGAALHIPQDELTPNGLVALLTELSDDPRRLQEMAERARALGKPNAVADIATALERELAHV